MEFPLPPLRPAHKISSSSEIDRCLVSSGRKGLVTAIAFLALGASVLTASAAEMPCAVGIAEQPAPLTITASQWTTASSSGSAQANQSGGANIEILPGPNLASNPAALAAFERAASKWERFLVDPITVTIEARFALITIPGPGFPIPIIGARGVAFPRTVIADYDEVADAMRIDSMLESDDDVVDSLPTATELQFFTSSTPPLGMGSRVNKANLKALGFVGLDEMFGESDGVVILASSCGVDADGAPLCTWDFDNSDGISAGALDFESTAMHEIAHLLGFTSGLNSTTGLPLTEINPTPLDFFRFRAAEPDNPESVSEFLTFSRSVETGEAAITDDLTEEFPMSTGSVFGASHWLADEISGVSIGLMDPSLNEQEIREINFSDVRALDLIGYDVLDSDLDRVFDVADNCLEDPNGPLSALPGSGMLPQTNQRDSDQDGYGNACDPDYDDDGEVNSLDFGPFFACFTGSPALPPDPNCEESDHDGIPGVDSIDFSIFVRHFLESPALPGPSGLACAGIAPCP